MKTVKAIMSPVKKDILKSDPLSKAVLWMHENRQSCVLICSDGALKGILTERDVLKIYASQLKKQLKQDLPIEQVMTPDPVCIQEDASINEALIIALNRKVRHLPVVDKHQKLVGLVTQNDTLSGYLNSLEAGNQLKTDIENLKALSLEDPLLGTGNRRALDVDLAHTQAAAKRYGKPFSIAMFDVDYFKRYNDRYGHQQGDEALKLVVRIIRANMRESDRLYRYGGEEFLLLMPDTQGQQAVAVAERIRQKMQDQQFLHEDSTLGVVTISAGVSHTDDDWHTALSQADQSLYQAKQSGRNTAVLWGAELNSQEP